MKDPVFKGSCTAMISPFKGNDLDLRKMGELLDFQEKNGTAAVLIAGTTGENAALEIHEHDELVDFCIKYTGGRMKTLIGIGGNNSYHCLDKALKAQESGADAVIMTTPYYNKSTQKGIIEHFVYVADRIEIPLMLYNIPSRTGIGIELETYKELAKHPNINGVKEASGNISLIARTIAECGNDLYVWSGNDDNTLPMMALGALGVISVASNIIPETVSMLCKLCFSGDYKAAAALYYRYSELFEKMFIETNPIPLKSAMETMGLCSGKMRLPLVEIKPENKEKLESCLKKLSLIS